MALPDVMKQEIDRRVRLRMTEIESHVRVVFASLGIEAIAGEDIMLVFRVGEDRWLPDILYQIKHNGEVVWEGEV